MIIDCIADLHGHYPKLDGGDLLIVAGDLTATHTEREFDDFWRWCCYQDYKAWVVIAGNHDSYLQERPDFLKDCGEDFYYLCDSGTEFEGLKIWGSPWTRTFPSMNPHCKAFTLDTEEELAEKWKLIPVDTDILVTHSPAFGYLDKSSRGKGYLGSTSLRLRLKQLYERECGGIQLHVCGHIHEGYGQMGDPIVPMRVNASLLDEDYEAVNKPIRIEL